ncbi:alpha/beta hydrolase, partial [Lacticaseibacillus paracasei subsp. paracasei Lpp71]
MSGWFWIVAAIGLVVVVGGLADYLLLARPGYQPVPLVMDPVPTLFIPGHLGTRYSFGHMLWRLQRRYGLSKDVVAIVAPDGKVHLRGQLNLNHHAAVQV